jgi:hypothetical protein
MSDQDESMLPASRPWGWKVIYLALATLGIGGIVLSVLYRDVDKRSDVIARERKKNATKVSYAVVLSRVDPSLATRIADEIIADIGADSLKTDLVIGSTVADPWAASIGEYRKVMLESMATSKDLNLGKQTALVSMITGLLTKVSKPSTVYLIGELHADDIAPVISRTAASAEAMRLRSELAAPITVVNYLTPPSKPIHKAYIDLFRGSLGRVQDRLSSTP